MKLNLYKNNQGFTLIELMVATFLMVFMSGIFVGAYNKSGRRSAVSTSAQIMSSTVRKVQSYSLGLREFNSGISLGGWGARMRKDQQNFDIFADLNNNHIYSNNELDQTLTLANGVRVSRIDFLRNNGNWRNNQANAYITYEPPDPLISICRGISSCDHSEVHITLSNQDGSYTKKVIINKFGLVDMENN